MMFLLSLDQTNLDNCMSDIYCYTWTMCGYSDITMEKYILNLQA